MKVKKIFAAVLLITSAAAFMITSEAADSTFSSYDVCRTNQYMTEPAEDNISTEMLTFNNEDLQLIMEECFDYPNAPNGIIPQKDPNFGDFMVSGRFPVIRVCSENNMSYASIENNTDGTSITGKRYSYLKNMQITDMDIRFASGIGQIRIAKGSVNGNDCAAQIEMLDGGLYVYNNDGTKTLLAENMNTDTWYHFRFVMNIDKQIWRLTVNDSEKIIYATPEGDSFGFKNDGIDMLRMSCIGINPGVRGTLNIANIRVYSAPLYEPKKVHSTTTLPKENPPLDTPIFTSKELLQTDKDEPQTTSGECELVDNRNGTVTLKNGLCSFTLNITTGELVKMNYNGGKNLLTSIYDVTKGYYSAASQIDGAKQANPTEYKYSVISENEDMIEISFLSDDAENYLGYILDMRYIIRKDVSGIYMYCILSADNKLLDEGKVISLEDTGYKLRTDRKVFPYYRIDDERYGEFHQYEIPKEEVMDATYRYPDGYVGGKYDNSVYTKDDHVTGVYNDGIGLWLIKGSTEDIPGGINKPELSVENGILQWYHNSGHGGTPKIYPKKNWKKICGPVLWYINEADNAEELWKDAKQQYEIEHGQWPYSWVTDSAYMADSRGSLHGKVKITDGTNPEGSWAIVADSEPNWQLQGENYQYATIIDENGEFTIKNIRPGIRSLYLVVNGVIEEYKLDNITINSNETTDIGTITWTPKTNGERLWQIGIPR